MAEISIGLGIVLSLILSETLGVTAGASAPEILVQELIQKLSEVFEITLKELSQVREDVHFSLPNSLLN